MEPIIRFDHVRKAFGELVVLEDLSLDLMPGQTTVIMGPSGVGKSVFLKMLVGLLYPDEGHIWVTGVAVPRAKEQQLRCDCHDSRFNPDGTLDPASKPDDWKKQPEFVKVYAVDFDKATGKGTVKAG